MQCFIKQNNERIAKDIEVANTFFTRFKGLMLRKNFPAEKALLLDPCPQIHTCFMRFAIDAIFLDKSGKVLYVKENMKPWRFGKFVRGAKYTLEFAANTLQGKVKIGDELIFVDKLGNTTSEKN